MAASEKNIIKDGIKRGWFSIEKVATQAIREHWAAKREKTRLSTALGLYSTLAELANDHRGDEIQHTRALIAKLAGVSPSAVSAYVAELESAGVIRVERRVVDGVNLPNIITLTDPGTTRSGVVAGDDDPAAQTRGVLAGDEGGSSQETTLLEEQSVLGTTQASAGSKKKEARASTSSQHEMPSDFPIELMPVLEQVVPILSGLANARGAPEPSVPALARAMMRRAEKASLFVVMADRLEYWALHGKGQRRQVKDVIARWRDWLDDEPAPPPQAAAIGPPGVAAVPTDIDEARRARRAAALDTVQAGGA